MTKLFRIVKRADFFIVQKKFLWFWFTAREADPTGQPRECPASLIIRFKSIEDARKYVYSFLQQPSRPKPEVIEYHKIIGSGTYCSTNEPNDL